MWIEYNGILHNIDKAVALLQIDYVTDDGEIHGGIELAYDPPKNGSYIGTNNITLTGIAPEEAEALIGEICRAMAKGEPYFSMSVKLKQYREETKKKKGWDLDELSNVCEELGFGKDFAIRLNQQVNGKKAGGEK